ncbi:MAG: hypothetical protein ACI37Q_06360 [Candidatus Gastranaerophilaceae bacterium]
MKIPNLSQADYTTSFKAKNTFLNKAKNSKYVIDNDYWKSLHHEAKSRLSYRSFKNARQELGQVDKTKPLSFLKTFSKMLLNGFQSEFHTNVAYYKFPDRFIRPDDLRSVEPRFYKIK